MQYRNLTPHPLHIFASDQDDEPARTIQPGLKAARLAEKRRTISPDFDGDGFPLTMVELGEIQNLPAPKSGVILIVSFHVAEKAQRADVVSPGKLKRDSEGNTVGSVGLTAYVEPGEAE